ncbi:MAG TPA: hypothetical protein VFE25_03375, partial [Opitutaceae bacterium]|nr:hypothetical protein [Opitutaceae bacterium]
MQLSSKLGKLLPIAGRTVRGFKSARARRQVAKVRPQIAANGEALRAFGTESGCELTGFTDAVLALDSKLNAVHAQASSLNLALQDHDEDKALSSAFELFKKSVDLAHSGIGIALTQEEEMEHI